VKDEVHPSEDSFYDSYAPSATCSEEQLDALANGSALVQDYILIDNSSASLFPDSASTAGLNGSSDTGVMPQLAGVASQTVSVADHRMLEPMQLRLCGCACYLAVH
jgi:hypothetical protein